MDDYGLAAAGRRAAESGVKGNASVGRETAGERTDDQVTGIRWVDQIKTHPVVARHFFVNALGNAVHEELDGGSGESIALNFTNKLGVAGVTLWPRGERGNFAGAEHRIAYRFILHEGREALAEENERSV